MTDAEWLSSTDPDELLIALHQKASERKTRLFCCACARRVWDRLAGAKGSCQAVEVAESFADGQATREELEVAWQQAQADIEGTTQRTKKQARRASAWCAHPTIDVLSVARSVAWGAAYARPRPKGAERISQVHLIRDIFSNPFRPTPCSLDWLSSARHTLIKLAEAAYEDRTFPSGTFDNARLAVLADALEDAGCDNSDILSHCRSSGPHVRGCWVVDLILDKK